MAMVIRKPAAGEVHPQGRISPLDSRKHHADTPHHLEEGQWELVGPVREST
jgi:hypothetical protein